MVECKGSDTNLEPGLEYPLEESVVVSELLHQLQSRLTQFIVDLQ